jgi:hypothetical protein
VCVCVRARRACARAHSLMNFIKNAEHFQINANVHSVNIRLNHGVYKPTGKLSFFQKCACNFGIIIIIFNKLLSDLKSLMNNKKMA